MDDAVALYGKYIGNWGGSATIYRFEAIKDGEVVKVLEKRPMVSRYLEVSCSHTALCENTTYDVAAIRFRMESDAGNLLNFCQDVITLSAEGDIAIIGPDKISLRGGMGGTYVKSIGKTGKGILTVSCEGLTPQKIEFDVFRLTGNLGNNII